MQSRMARQWPWASSALSRGVTQSSLSLAATRGPMPTPTPWCRRSTSPWSTTASSARASRTPPTSASCSPSTCAPSCKKELELDPLLVLARPAASALASVTLTRDSVVVACVIDQVPVPGAVPGGERAVPAAERHRASPVRHRREQGTIHTEAVSTVHLLKSLICAPRPRMAKRSLPLVIFLVLVGFGALCMWHRPFQSLSNTTFGRSIVLA